MIVLYTSGSCPDSHRARIVLAEKELPVDYVEVESADLPVKLLEMNPYGKLPTLVDRETVLFEASVINEYLDERYPHPPLKPGSPSERAQMRLWVMRIVDEMYPIYHALAEAADAAKREESRGKMAQYLEAMDIYLARQTYLVAETYTLADITMAPVLWRLSAAGLSTAPWPNLEAYMDRLFERDAFTRSLSEHEQMLHS